MSDGAEALRRGRFTAGGSEVALGEAYTDLFKRVAGFPERPRTFWPLEGGGTGEAFAWIGDFLDFKGVPVDWQFHDGKLRQATATDLEDDGFDNDRACRRVDALIAAWTARLGPPAKTFGLQGRTERSATWIFPGLAFSAFFETRTPSVGYCVRPTA